MRPSFFGRAFFHSRLYVKRCRVLTDWPCRPPMWPSLDKYAGEDMQVCRSKGFFNKRPVNENGALPADLHIFPCISVEVGRGVLGSACWTSRGCYVRTPPPGPPLRPTRSPHFAPLESCLGSICAHGGYSAWVLSGLRGGGAVGVVKQSVLNVRK